jgi:uncharacterized protein DUF2550
VRIVDIGAVCVVLLVVVLFGAVLARQRHMLRLGGSVPLAVQRGTRWMYGIGRYQGSELRWYRALGVGTRPSRVFRRGDVQVVRRRTRLDSERTMLPENAVVVTCRVGADMLDLALGDSAFTGFVSWLESSAPRA